MKSPIFPTKETKVKVDQNEPGLLGTAGRTAKLMILNVAGLSLNVIGTLLLASLLFVSKKKAEELSGTYYGGNEQQRLELLRQSAIAKCRAGLIVAGFLLQIVGSLRSR